MGPGGGWNFGSPPVTYVGGQRGLSLFLREPTQEEKVIAIAAVTLVSGPLAIVRGAGLGISAARIILLAILFPPSPGGGGPGHSPISYDPPPSVREQGRSLAEAGTYGRTPSPSVGKESRASRGSRKRCPSGYRWNGHRCVKR